MNRLFFMMGLVLVLSLSVQAQTKEEVELFQAVFGMEKKEIVAEFVALEGQAAAGFWTLYDQYETERKLHGKKRISLLNRYALQYETLDDPQTDQILKDMRALGKEYDNLIHKYYKQIRKTVGAKTAAQFYQLEVYFQSAIRLEIFDQIPLIGEFDK